VRIVPQALVTKCRQVRELIRVGSRPGSVRGRLLPMRWKALVHHERVDLTEIP
jgi:hypothetical protein